MKQYIHKHIMLESQFWEIIDNYMVKNNLDNFTELVRTSLIEKINRS